MVRNLCEDRSNKGHKGVQYHTCDICSECKSSKTLIVILISSMRSPNASVFCALPPRWSLPLSLSTWELWSRNQTQVVQSCMMGVD